MASGRVVVGIVVDNSNVLMVLRKERENDLTWVFPGGAVQQEETETAAVKREVFEETGVVCTPVNKLGGRVHPNSEKLISYWHCSYDSGVIVSSDPDIAEAKWVPVDTVQDIITSDLYPAVKQFLEKSA